MGFVVKLVRFYKNYRGTPDENHFKFEKSIHKFQEGRKQEWNENV